MARTEEKKKKGRREGRRKEEQEQEEEQEEQEQGQGQGQEEEQEEQEMEIHGKEISRPCCRRSKNHPFFRLLVRESLWECFLMGLRWISPQSLNP